MAVTSSAAAAGSQYTAYMGGTQTPVLAAAVYEGIQIVQPTYNVSQQYPQAGSSVPVGSTVYVSLVDLNYYNLGQISAVNNPAAMDSMTLAQATQMLADNPDLQEAVSNPDVQISGEMAAQLINESSGKVMDAALTLDATEGMQALEALRYIAPTEYVAAKEYTASTRYASSTYNYRG